LKRDQNSAVVSAEPGLEIPTWTRQLFGKYWFFDGFAVVQTLSSDYNGGHLICEGSEP
jgi:hypothetical protein